MLHGESFRWLFTRVFRSGARSFFGVFLVLAVCMTLGLMASVIMRSVEDAVLTPLVADDIQRLRITAQPGASLAIDASSLPQQLIEQFTADPRVEQVEPVWALEGFVQSRIELLGYGFGSLVPVYAVESLQSSPADTDTMPVAISPELVPLVAAALAPVAPVGDDIAERLLKQAQMQVIIDGKSYSLDLIGTDMRTPLLGLLLSKSDLETLAQQTGGQVLLQQIIITPRDLVAASELSADRRYEQYTISSQSGPLANTLRGVLLTARLLIAVPLALLVVTMSIILGLLLMHLTRLSGQWQGAYTRLALSLRPLKNAFTLSWGMVVASSAVVSLLLATALLNVLRVPLSALLTDIIPTAQLPSLQLGLTEYGVVGIMVVVLVLLYPAVARISS